MPQRTKTNRDLIANSNNIYPPYHDFDANGYPTALYWANNHEGALDHRYRVTLASTKTRADDETIDIVESHREYYISEMIHAVYNMEDVQDNSTFRGRTMMDRTHPDHHSPYDVEATCRYLFIVIIDRCNEGYRGLASHNRLLAPKPDPQDVEGDCQQRINNVIRALRDWKSICREVLLEDSKVNQLANAPASLWKDKRLQQGNNKQKKASLQKDREAAHAKKGKKRRGNGDLPPITRTTQIRVNGKIEGQDSDEDEAEEIENGEESQADGGVPAVQGPPTLSAPSQPIRANNGHGGFGGRQNLFGSGRYMLRGNRAPTVPNALPTAPQQQQQQQQPKQAPSTPMQTHRLPRGPSFGQRLPVGAGVVQNNVAQGSNIGLNPHMGQNPNVARTYNQAQHHSQGQMNIGQQGNPTDNYPMQRPAQGYIAPPGYTLAGNLQNGIPPGTFFQPTPNGPIAYFPTSVLHRNATLPTFQANGLISQVAPQNSYINGGYTAEAGAAQARAIERIRLRGLSAPVVPSVPNVPANFTQTPLPFPALTPVPQPAQLTQPALHPSEERGYYPEDHEVDDLQDLLNQPLIPGSDDELPDVNSFPGPRSADDVFWDGPSVPAPVPQEVVPAPGEDDAVGDPVLEIALQGVESGVGGPLSMRPVQQTPQQIHQEICQQPAPPSGAPSPDHAFDPQLFPKFLQALKDQRYRTGQPQPSEAEAMAMFDDRLRLWQQQKEQGGNQPVQQRPAAVNVIPVSEPTAQQQVPQVATPTQVPAQVQASASNTNEVHPHPTNEAYKAAKRGRSASMDAQGLPPASRRKLNEGQDMDQGGIQ
ncbi:hypothetical protein E8E13_001314 [Curvularia kusanoi]|uniref:Uncharacterized protein n=1 Tax=Curvularia kusanoi TaxID=90978 RepID=A0A9P4TG61_CURKU|nr:hypothetical protein E8E13_001314 [Curvularia kusanoi]